MKEKKVKKKKTWWQRVLISLAWVVGVFAFVLLCAIGYFRLPVSDYYSASEKAFKIPGLSDDFVPQGMHYDEKTDCFFVSGYSSNDEASPVYLVNKTSGETVSEVRLQNEDGTPFTGHAGGVAVFDDFVYIAGGGDNCLYVFNYADFFSQQTAKCIGEFSLKVSKTDYLNASFVTVVDNLLFVGEFYDGGKYKTLDSHTVETQGGETNHALMLVLQLFPSAPFGIFPALESAFSIPNKVQGVHYDRETGKVYFSTSYGASFSHIYEHEMGLAKRETDITLLGEKLTLESFDRTSCVHDYKIPPMSEEIVVLDGELYVMCESASSKYIFGKFTGGKWCYKTKLSEMKE